MAPQPTADEDAQTETIRAVKTTDAELEEKMPDSIAGFGASLEASVGRTFTCPECGEASTGTCPKCGYTHTAFRDDPTEYDR